MINKILNSSLDSMHILFLFPTLCWHQIIYIHPIHLFHSWIIASLFSFFFTASFPCSIYLLRTPYSILPSSIYKPPYLLNLPYHISDSILPFRSQGNPLSRSEYSSLLQLCLSSPSLLLVRIISITSTFANDSRWVLSLSSFEICFVLQLILP